MEEIRKNIARNILYYRKKLGLTQRELADRLGVRNSAISNWEKEQNSPDIETLFAMCNIFGISIADIYGIDSQSSSVSTTSPLAPDEEKLIEDYRTPWRRLRLSLKTNLTIFPSWKANHRKK